MALPHLLTHVCVYVCVCVCCVYIPTAPEGIKTAPLTGVNPKKYPFITLLVSLSHFLYSIESCNSSQHLNVELHPSQCQ